jgi:hypothetical protein
VRHFGARHAWLSITPEPERELPEAIATLRAAGTPAPDLVERERARVERLVTRGSRREWRDYLAGVSALADAASGGGSDVAEARALVDEVIRNHDNLALGLASRRSPGRLTRNGGSA